MLSFEHLAYLWILMIPVILVILFSFVLKWKKRVRASLGDLALIQRLTRNYAHRAYKIKFYLVIIALLLGVAAAMGLRRPTLQATEKSAGIDIIVALDVSRSMLSQDIKPTRLDRAKQLIGNMIDQLYNNRVGFVVFAGQAILQMPLTDDVGAMKMYLSNVNTNMVPIPGTAIGAALSVADQALQSPDKKHKAVILITDGEDHDEATDKAVKQLYNDGVTVFTIGVGTPGGTPIFDPSVNGYMKDQNGKVVISKLNEKELKNIAAGTNGSFVLLNNDEDAIHTIVGKINGMEKKMIATGTVGSRSYFYFFPFMIAVMLLLLVVEIFIPERKRSVA